MYPPPSPTMTAVPPLPPQIQAQQVPPSPAATFSQMAPAGPGGQPGMGIPNPITVLKAQMAKLEAWAAETVPLLSQVNPALSTLLIPIAQAGKAMQTEIDQMEQRNAGPSPQVQGSNPPNLPGNIPGGRPAQ